MWKVKLRYSWRKNLTVQGEKKKKQIKNENWRIRFPKEEAGRGKKERKIV